MSWTALIILSLGAYVFKVVGVIAGNRFADRLAPLTALLPAALFSALIVVMSVSNGNNFVFDARLLGVAGGIFAVALRAPMFVTVIVAMGCTALFRLLV